jgi:SET and MYND domain-containing protein
MPLLFTACDVESTPSCGRGLVAARDTHAGDVLFRESAYACVVNQDQAKVLCHCCFRTAEEAGVEALLRCSRCKYARYCTAEHQRAAWAGGDGAAGCGHRHECAWLQRVAPRRPSQTVRLAARSVRPQYILSKYALNIDITVVHML